MKFSVRYLDPQGKLQVADLDLPTQDDVLRHSRTQNWTVLDVRAQEVKAKVKSVQRGWEPFGIRPSVVVFFTRQMAELTETGIPLVQTLETLQRFSTSGKLQDVIGAVIDDISQGRSFSDALKRHPKVFNPIYTSSVEVGERTGRIALMMGRVADYLEKEEATRSRLKSALTYPAFILSFCLLLSWAMVTFLLPGFMPMFTESGLNLSNYPLTQFLIAMNRLCTNFWDEVFVATVIGVIMFLYYRAINTDIGRGARDQFMFRLPLIGGFLRLSAHSRICHTLAILQDAGMPIYQAMDLAAIASDNEVTRAAVMKAKARMETGVSLSDAMGENEDAFPPLMVQMMVVGEESGNVPRMLSRIATYYDSQLESSIKAFSSMIEPIMMMLVGLIVGVFVLGIFGPIMGVVGALQSKM